jgi:YD repeat-containing protein
MNDGTTEQYNSQGLMISSTDRLGEITRHIYNSAGQIQQIIDPVGLSTTFNYTGNRVTSMIDPAGRITRMEYDTDGNLTAVIDPDGTKSQYSYDSSHRRTTTVTKTGETKVAIYDEFGRVKAAVREDGSIVNITPIAVQGLQTEQATTNLNGLPIAQVLASNPIATYADGNGNISRDQIDTYGRIVTSIDAVGNEHRFVRDSRGRIVDDIASNGSTTTYQYDERDNVIKITETGRFGNEIKNNLAPTPYEFLARNSSSIRSIFTGDLNKDGYVDIIALNNKINILFGDAK